MTRISELTEANCLEIEEELEAATAAIAQKYGILFQKFKGVLSSDAATFATHVQFSLPPRVETVASVKEERDFLQYAESFGVQANWLGKEFQRGNFSYKVVGLRVDAPKECIILQRSDGSRCHENGKLVANFMTA